MHRHKLVAASGVGENAIRATNLIGELGDAVEFGVALDLNTNKDEVVGSEVGSRTTFVDTVAVSLAAVRQLKRRLDERSRYDGWCA